MPIESVSGDALNQFVRDLHAGRIFTVQHMADQSRVDMVFMVLALGGMQGIDVDDIGTVYEYLDRAGPLAVNGMPTFFSARFLNRADWKAALSKLAAIETATAAALAAPAG